MAWPWIIGGAVALGAALVGAMSSDDEGSNEKTKATSDSLQTDVKIEQKKGAVVQMQKNLYRVWKNTATVLAFENKEHIELYNTIAKQIILGEVSAANALNRVARLCISKSNYRFPTENEFFMELNSISKEMTDRYVERIITTAQIQQDLLEKTFESSRNVNICDSLYAAKNLMDQSATMNALCDTFFNSNYCKTYAAIEQDMILYEEGLYLRKVNEWFSTCTPNTFSAPPQELSKYYSELVILSEKAMATQSAVGEPRIVVCGLLKAGKSSLLNSLLGDTEQQTFEVGIVRKTISNQEIINENVCYIDTPGFEANEEDTLEAQKAYRTADILLFVHCAERELIKSECDLLAALQKEVPHFAERTFFVLSRIDLAQDNLEKLKEKIHKQMQSALGFALPIYEVSNSRYKKGIVEGKQALVKASGIEHLRKNLSQICEKNRDSIQRKQKENVAQLYSSIEQWIKAQEKKNSVRIKEKNDSYFAIMHDIFENACAPIKRYYK